LQPEGIVGGSAIWPMHVDTGLELEVNVEQLYPPFGASSKRIDSGVETDAAVWVPLI